MSFFHEIKRRHVFKVGIAYLVTGWLIAQIADVGLSTFGAPDWVAKTVLFLLIAGFTVALLLAWAYELTPAGIKVDPETRRTRVSAETLSTRLDYAIIAGLLIALGYFVADKYFWSEAEAPPPAAGEASIAVLPFENVSPDSENEYLAEGLAEELLNLLARVPDLKVPARTSSFSFKGTNSDVREIAEKLGVEYILEGSVRKSGDRIRITAQLIRAGDGYQQWSNAWDRELVDVFEIQDEIAAAVVEQLRVQILGELPRSRRVDPEAYELYLQRGELSGAEANIELLSRVIALDENFAEAWAAMSVSLINEALNDPSGRARNFAFAEAAAQRAFAIDPYVVRAHIALSGIELTWRRDFARAEEALGRAIHLQPRHSGVLTLAAIHLEAFGLIDSAIALRLRIPENEPMHRPEIRNLAFSLVRGNRLAEAQETVDYLVSIGSSDEQLREVRAELEYRKGQFENVSDLVPSDGLYWTVLRTCAAYAVGDRAAADSEMALLLADTTGREYRVAEAYACRKESRKAFDWLERARSNRDPMLMFALRTDFLLESLHDSSEWGAFLESLGVSDNFAPDPDALLRKFDR